MATCKQTFIKYFLLIFLLILCIKNAQADIDSIKFSPKNLIIMKYDIFFLKNKDRVINDSQFSFMVRYQQLEHKVEILKDDEIKIYVNAYMNYQRYKKQKKYKPKIQDCNIVRNKLVLKKHGYNIFSYKKNYSVTKDLLFKAIKNEIYDFSGLSDDLVKYLIEKTSIYVKVVHPISNLSLSCSGKITDSELS
tara:strand:+ start:362 stop:937 length:576 start_codon:yes stop_codon:yes gene_type:complete